MTDRYRDVSAGPARARPTRVAPHARHVTARGAALLLLLTGWLASAALAACPPWVQPATAPRHHDTRDPFVPLDVPLADDGRGAAGCCAYTDGRPHLPAIAKATGSVPPVPGPGPAAGATPDAGRALTARRLAVPGDDVAHPPYYLLFRRLLLPFPA